MRLANLTSSNCKKEFGNFSGLEPDCTVRSGWALISVHRMAVRQYLEMDPDIFGFSKK